MKATALLTPILLAGLSGCVTNYEQNYVVSKAPEDDEALRNWVEEQPGVHEVSVMRDGNSIHLRYARYGPRWEFKFLTPPLNDLGYEISGGIGLKSTRTNRLMPWVPNWVVVVAVVAVAALVAGARRLRRRRRAEAQA